MANPSMLYRRSVLEAVRDAKYPLTDIDIHIWIEYKIKNHDETRCDTAVSGLVERGYLSKTLSNIIPGACIYKITPRGEKALKRSYKASGVK